MMWEYTIILTCLSYFQMVINLIILGRADQRKIELSTELLTISATAFGVLAFWGLMEIMRVWVNP